MSARKPSLATLRARYMTADHGQLAEVAAMLELAAQRVLARHRGMLDGDVLLALEAACRVAQEVRP